MAERAGLLERAVDAVLPEHTGQRLAAGRGTAWQYLWRTPVMLGLLLAAWICIALRTRGQAPHG